MTKKMLPVCVEELSRFDMEGTLGNLKTYVERLIEAHGEDATLDTWMEGEYEFNVYKNREETDEEYQLRLAQEKRWVETKEKNEREQFEALKKKYGNE